MIVLMSLGGEFVFELVRFLIMLVLIVCAVMLGKKLRDMSDTRKAAKAAMEVDGNQTQVTETESKEK